MENTAKNHTPEGEITEPVGEILEGMTEEEYAELKKRVRKQSQSHELAWISVKDQLPEAEEEVLVTVRNKKESYCYVDIAVYSLFSDSWVDEDFFGLFDFQGGEDFEVTHWMKLPEPAQ